MVTTRGKSHTFLGMNFTIRDDKKIEIEMTEQVKETIAAFGEEITNHFATPAGGDMYVSETDDELLEKEQKERFHSVTAKLLYLMKRVRPDLEPAVAYLCTRATKSTTRDWKKLKRVLSYMKDTADDKRIIGANSVNDIFTWIDAAHAVHENMRSQTGGCMSMGWGVFHARSGKQKINTKSSTESELVGTSDYLPYDIWAIMFLMAQGYKIVKNILFQDNQSEIRMLKNGRNSCTGNSRHIDVRYFWVKDRINKGELTVEYCPTHLMLADYFTKPLQGSQFRKFRDIIMGYKPISTLFDEIALKERVELCGDVSKK